MGENQTFTLDSAHAIANELNQTDKLGYRYEVEIESDTAMIAVYDNGKFICYL